MSKDSLQNLFLRFFHYKYIYTVTVLDPDMQASQKNPFLNKNLFIPLEMIMAKSSWDYDILSLSNLIYKPEWFTSSKTEEKNPGRQNAIEQLNLRNS